METVVTSDIERDELAASMRSLAKRVQILVRSGPERVEAGTRFRDCLNDILRLLAAGTELIYRSSVQVPRLTEPGAASSGGAGGGGGSGYRGSGGGYGSGSGGFTPPPPRHYSEGMGSPGAAPIGSSADLQGSTRIISMWELMDMLGTHTKSGTLRVKGQTETFTILFQDGSVVHAVSDHSPPGHRLGDILVANGAIEPERLNQFIVRHSRTGGKIGVALEREELVSREQLSVALEQQIQFLFHRLFGSKDASFIFQERTTETYEHRVRINVTQLLLESARNQDEALR